MNYPAHDPALPVVCFDFDGVVARNTWPSPRLGYQDPEAFKAMLHYYDAGCEVVIFTARPDEHLPLIRTWLKERGMDYVVYEITNRKPKCCLYFDDRAVRWPLKGGATTEQEDVLARFVEELRKPTGDGAQKRSRNEKPPWYLDDSHHRAVFSHYMKWLGGEKVDPDSGGSPLAHAAWRLLAMACIESGNVPGVSGAERHESGDRRSPRGGQNG